MQKYNKTMAQILREMNEATVSVFDISYDDVPKSKLTQAAKKFGIRMKKLPKNKVSFGGDDAIEFSGSDSNLLKFAKQQFGTTARNIRDLKKELEEELEEDQMQEDEMQEGRMKDLSMKVNNIVAKMKKNRQIKGFADKFKRDVMKTMDIEKSLEKVLPDFISGREIQKLVKEQETDPVAKAQDKLDKARRIADLKKQIDDIKTEEVNDIEEETLNEFRLFKIYKNGKFVGRVRARDEKAAIEQAYMKLGSASRFSGAGRQAFKAVREEVSDEIDEITMGALSLKKLPTLRGTITDKQIQNLKKVWAKKSKRDVTPSLKKMLKKLDAPTRAALANANINVISKLVPEEALDDKDVDTIKPIIKQLKKSVKAHDKQAKQLQKDIQDDVNEATVTIKSYDTKTGLDRQAEKQMNAVATRAGAKVKKSGNNVYKVTGDGKQLSKFMANIDQIDGSFMTEESEFMTEFTSSQIKRLKKEYEPLRGTHHTELQPARFTQLRKMMGRMGKPQLQALVKADIPVLSSAAKASLVINHGMKFSSIKEELIPYLEVFSLDEEKKSKFKSVEPQVINRIEKMMKGNRAEKDSIANMMNYLMPPEVVDMVRDKLKITAKRGKIKF
jgi:hypothetical protein